MKSSPGIFLLVSVLTLVVAPATCSGGVLVHYCTPQDADHGTDHHEDACPSDPCNRDSLFVAVRSADDDGCPDAVLSPADLPVRLVLSDYRTGTANAGGLQLRASACGGVLALPLLC